MFVQLEGVEYHWYNRYRVHNVVGVVIDEFIWCRSEAYDRYGHSTGEVLANVGCHGNKLLYL